MNDQTGFPPFDSQNPNPMPPIPSGFDYNPMGSYPPTSMPKEMGSSKSAIFVYGVFLALITLIVPVGMFKVGAPAPCEGERLKNKECVIVENAEGCTPRLFSLESEYLTCKMMNAYAPPDYKEIDKKFAETYASKATTCAELNNEVRKNNGLKCFATGAIAKAKGGKAPNVMEMAPLEVQKLSLLNSISSSTLNQDLLFTAFLFIVVLIMMGAAAFMAHKKHRDGFLHIVAVFILGIFVSYLYRYYAGGFFEGNIIILILSLVGIIPVAIIAMSAAGHIGKSRDDIAMMNVSSTGEYVLLPPQPEPPVPSEPLAISEATRFERMAMEHTPLPRAIFTLGFIALVLSLMPIGLVSMGKSSNANARMQEEARVSALIRKSSEEATTTDSSTEIEEGGGVEAPEGSEGGEGGEGGGEGE